MDENKKIKVAFIGDIHLGIKTTEHLYEELVNVFLPQLTLNKIDVVMIVGDYFDKELVGSHKYYATKFFAELTKVCVDNNIILRMIKGTHSHDLNQLQGFFGATNIMVPELDFKIITTVDEEKIMGLDILYIPEEELLNQDEYYAPYKAKTYDFIAGHGNWDFMPMAGFLMSHNNYEKLASPVHLAKDWDKVIPHGFSVFGHIHNADSFKNKFFYTRSFSRWKYGEEEDKGFWIFTIDKENKTYESEYVVNHMAPLYNSLKFDDVVGTGGLQENSISDIRKKLKELAKTNTTGRFRINVTDLTPTEITILQKAASTLENIDLEIEAKSVQEILNEQIEEKDIQEYVIHPERFNMTPEDVIIKFIQETSGEIITMSELTEALTSDK